MTRCLHYTYELSDTDPTQYKSLLLKAKYSEALPKSTADCNGIPRKCGLMECTDNVVTVNVFILNDLPEMVRNE
jgi:hypothetical protein